MLNVNLILETALLAGSIMACSGAETSRIEDTCGRIIQANQIADYSVLVFTTGIFITINENGIPSTRQLRLKKRSVNLDKIDRVNTLSRCVERGDLTTAEAFVALKSIEQSPPLYKPWQHHLASASASAGFAYLFNTPAKQLPFTFAVGFLTSYIFSFLLLFAPHFFADFGAAFFAASAAKILHNLGLIASPEGVIIGAIMILVPGLLITTAIQDALNDDLLMALGKVTEALFVALAIAGGVTFALSLGEVFLNGAS